MSVTVQASHATGSTDEDTARSDVVVLTGPDPFRLVVVVTSSTVAVREVAVEQVAVEGPWYAPVATSATTSPSRPS